MCVCACVCRDTEGIDECTLPYHTCHAAACSEEGQQCMHEHNSCTSSCTCTCNRR